MLPEEKMAARVLAKRKLEPPYDLKALALSYGDLSFKRFPFKADGITVGIGIQTRPHIIINTDCPETRQKFTLAHEIGHVVIPWHTGTVISHLEPANADHDYWVMEQEANRFAAELLMPTAWLKIQFANASTVQDYFRRILEMTGASKEAVYYKAFRCLDAAIVCARIAEDGETVENSVRSRLAPAGLVQGSKIKNAFTEVEFTSESFVVDNMTFHVWRFQGKEIVETDDRSWREILNQILIECNLQNKLGSINSIMSAAFDKHKHLTEENICGAVIRSFSTRSEIPQFKEHPLFEQYVIKRVRELQVRLIQKEGV